MLNLKVNNLKKIYPYLSTEMEHYRLVRPSILTESSYVPGDKIEIKTINDTKLERSRQFEVIIEDPSHDPLNVLNPNRVIVTIRDDDGMFQISSLSLSLSLSPRISLSLPSYLKFLPISDITIHKSQVSPSISAN